MRDIRQLGANDTALMDAVSCFLRMQAGERHQGQQGGDKNMKAHWSDTRILPFLQADKMAPAPDFVQW